MQNRINGLAEAVARSFKMHRPGRGFSAASRYASGDQLTCCLVTPGRRPLRPDRSTSVGRVTVIAPERREALHRRALRLEYLTVGWNVLEAVVAIGAGVLAGSVALIAFGADSGIEIVSAVGLLWRLRKAGPYAPVGEESEAEKRALYVVAVTFFLLAVYTIYEGLTGLFNSEEPLTSPIGIALSLSSLVIMPILAYAKQRTGKQMGSRALVADSKETWVCSYLSLALLIGVGAYALRLVVGGFAGCARHAAGDRPAGLGNPSRSSRARRLGLTHHQVRAAAFSRSGGFAWPAAAQDIVAASLLNAAQARSLRVQVDLAALARVADEQCGLDHG